MVRFFVGKVESVDEALHTINFTMEDFTNGDAIPIPAIPLVPTLILPEQDDEVLVIQPDSDIEIFYYTQMPVPDQEDTFVEMRYGNAFVKILKNDNKYTITVETGNDGPNMILGDNSVTIKSSQSGSDISMSDSQVLINGHLKVLK